VVIKEYMLDGARCTHRNDEKYIPNFVGVEVLTAVVMKSTTFWESATCVHAGFLLSLFFDAEDESDVSPKRRLTFNGLHGAISQKTVLVI
jgi:hypothetical protein